MLCRPGISSMSLGRAWAHSIDAKLLQAARAGFEGVEIFYEDLEYITDTYPDGRTPSNLVAAAAYVRSLCDSLNLTIINIQPFTQYEGLRDRARHAARVEEMKTWFLLADALGTDLISIPASFLPASEVTGDMDTIVSDLRLVADMGLARSPPIRFNYENLCWSTYVDTWEKCWDVVRRVDRPNFGICLDTFNILGRVYADPAAASGRLVDAEAQTRASIARLVQTVDVSKVFFLQVVDAERLAAPLNKAHEFYVEGQPARMSWSRNCRLFYGEEERGAYLPVRELLGAIVGQLGFRGWVSMELFNRSMAETGDGVPVAHARRGMASWARMKRDFKELAGPMPAPMVKMARSGGMDKVFAPETPLVSFA